jgi:hypothetical protein
MSAVFNFPSLSREGLRGGLSMSRLDAGECSSSAQESFERADARTHPNPSLEREGR